MTAIEDLMRHLLWLPEPGSTFAVPVDRLHFFVITVTMIASTITGLLAFVFFFKYRETCVQRNLQAFAISFLQIGRHIFF